MPLTNPVATRSATRPSISALVSSTCRSPRAGDRRPRLHADQPEDVLVLGLAQPEPERAAHEVDEHDRRPRRGVGHEQQRHHQQGGDDEADHEAHDAAGELRSGLATELPLHAADRPKREAPGDAADHEAARRAQEDEEQGAAGALARDGAAQQEPAGAEAGR